MQFIIIKVKLNTPCITYLGTCFLIILNRNCHIFLVLLQKNKYQRYMHTIILPCSGPQTSSGSRFSYFLGKCDFHCIHQQTKTYCLKKHHYHTAILKSHCACCLCVLFINMSTLLSQHSLGTFADVVTTGQIHVTEQLPDFPRKKSP